MDFDYLPCKSVENESVNCHLIDNERAWITSVLAQYRVSYTRGFVPEEDPQVIFTVYLCLLIFKQTINIIYMLQLFQ